MQSDFKKVAQELKDAVEEVLTKFTEVEQLKSNPELALVKTHLVAAKQRVEQELSKYDQSEAEASLANPSRSTIVAQSANVPVTRPIDPNAPTAPESQQQQVDDNSNPPASSAPNESAEGSTQSDEKTSTDQEAPSTDTETGAPAQTPETTQPTTTPEAGTTVSPPADQPETPVVQPESTGTDTTLNGQLAANTPSGQVSQQQADEDPATA